MPQWDQGTRCGLSRRHGQFHQGLLHCFTLGAGWREYVRYRAISAVTARVHFGWRKGSAELVGYRCTARYKIRTGASHYSADIDVFPLLRQAQAAISSLGRRATLSRLICRKVPRLIVVETNPDGLNKRFDIAVDVSDTVAIWRIRGPE